MLISRNLLLKSSEVSIKTRSTLASLSFKGQATKQETVKWSIETIVNVAIILGYVWLQKVLSCVLLHILKQATKNKLSGCNPMFLLF